MAKFLDSKGLTKYTSLLQGELDALDTRIEALENGGKYMPLTGGTFTGNVTMGSGAKLSGIATPVSNNDAANKAYVDSKAGSALYTGISDYQTESLLKTFNVTSLVVTVSWQDNIQTSIPCIAVTDNTDEKYGTAIVFNSDNSRWALLGITVFHSAATTNWISNAPISTVDVTEVHHTNVT